LTGSWGRGGVGAAAAAQALAALAGKLRAEETVISAHVVDCKAMPALGMLAAAGPRGTAAPLDYALVVEAVREGYLLHYGEPRLLAGHDRDLALLAGDYLYARGIERLASLGDAAAVRWLADLISLCAQCHAESRSDLVSPLWLAATVAVGAGADAAAEAALEEARRLAPDAASSLLAAARAGATSAGLEAPLGRAAEAIDFRVHQAADG
jgi:hypothetical protein